MKFLEPLLNQYRNVIIHDCKIYIPQSKRNETEFKAHKKLEEYYIRQNGGFKNLENFLTKAVSPRVELSKKELFDLRNLNLDYICSRNKYLGVNKNHFIFLKENATGTTFIDGKRMKGVKKINNLFLEPQLFKKTKITKLNNGYRIYKKVPPHTLKNNGNTYLFPRTDIFIDLTKRGNTFKIKEPRTKEGYRHPVVFSDGDICYNDNSRWNNQKIIFTGRTPGYSSLYDILKVLDEGVYNLTEGYFNNINPVKRLNKTNFGEFLI